MHQTRPQQSRIFSIIAHVINLCMMGEYLNATINQSMQELAICLQLLNETFEHMFDRRTREMSNVVRIEIFLLFNNLATPIYSGGRGRERVVVVRFIRYTAVIAALKALTFLYSPWVFDLTPSPLKVAKHM